MSLKQLTIGADPEIAIVSPLHGKYVSAQSLITDDMSRSGEFGLDGNPSTLELRPKPSTNPLEVVENIYQILESAKTKYPQIFRMNLKASDNNLSIGGHVHFGTSQKDGMLPALNTLLALPLSLVENKKHRYARVENSSYGKWGDARSQEWGFEYRTLPSWLATRQLSEATLSLGYLIVDQIYRGKEVNPALLKLIPESELQELFKRGYTGAIKTFMPTISRDIYRLDGIQKYRKQIDYLLKSSREGRPLLDIEIKDGWHIKFLRIADLKLSNLSDLIKRVGEASTVGTVISLDGGIQAGNDYRCESIAMNSWGAVKNVIGGDILS